jgi:hypothetical protein
MPWKGKSNRQVFDYIARCNGEWSPRRGWVYPIGRAADIRSTLIDLGVEVVSE